MAEIFVSYRREDTVDFAGRLSDRLRRRFGTARIFLAPDDIPLGQPFDKVLGEQLDSCQVLLAVIGRHWLTVNQAVRRPSDYVEIEIGTALQRRIPTVPIRVDGAPVPTNLPGPLAALPGQQWLRIDRANFHSGADLLIEQLEKNYIPSIFKRRSLLLAQTLLAIGGILIGALSPWPQKPLALLAFGLAFVLFYSPTRGWPWRR